MTFKERIQMFASYYGMTVAQLQEKLGLSNAYFSNVNKISPRVQVVVRENFPEANIDWLNYERGTMLLNEVPSIQISNIQVPLVPTYAIAGRLTDFTSQTSEIDCERILSPVREASLAITISGDSMSPEYGNGSIIFLKRIDEKAFIEWGKTYVLDTINGVVVKNVFPCAADKDCVVCKSINPNYPDFEVQKKDVLGWYRVLLEMSRK